MNSYNNELYHHGILGQKWGVRRFQNDDGSLTSEGRKRYGYYSFSPRGRREFNAVRNRVVADAIRLGDNANSPKNQARIQKLERKAQLLEVDPELAKNKQTKRVAMDYHNLTDTQFKGKYHTSKNTFAKRYLKTDGDTYSRGLRGAAIATKLIGKNADVSMYKVITGKDDPASRLGKASASKILASDILYSEAVTRIGYNKAEANYQDRKAFEEFKSNRKDRYE